jgi:tryptophan-rich sensory protein
VWTVLYFLMGVAAWLVWRAGGFLRSGGALPVFVVQLAMNALWSWLFFVWHSGAWSFTEIMLLWGLVAATMVLFWRVSSLAGLLLVPYLLWITYAAALCRVLWKMNPDVLG